MEPGSRPDRLEAEVLAVSERGDGRHRVLKLHRAGRPLVAKCYGRKTGRLRTRLRQFGSLCLVGKSSITPSARRRTEREVLELWKREGFDVPEVLDDVEIPGLDEPYLLLSWIPGPSLAEMLRVRSESPERERDLVRGLASATGRRHARALASREPRLLLEHPTIEHVLVVGDRLVWLDFEIVFRRSRSLDRLARREVAGFLHSMAKTAGDRFPGLVAEFVSAYPDRRRLERVFEDLRRYHAVPVAAWLGAAQRIVRRRRRYDKRRYMVETFGRVLGAADAPAPAPTGPGSVSA